MTPLSFPVRYGWAEILIAPSKLVALVETPDIAIGAVDLLKRRVVLPRVSDREQAQIVGYICFLFRCTALMGP